MMKPIALLSLFALLCTSAAPAQADPGDPACNVHDPADAPPAAPVQVDLRNAPLRGAPDAPVKVVVFSDFECGFCAKLTSTLDTLQTKYGPKTVAVAFKQAPLPFHTHARYAARASLAAAAQGRFWELHDALFRGATPLDEASVEAQVRRLGMDVTAFRRAAASREVEAALQADVAQGAALGVTGTPTMFVNGRRFVGNQPLDKILALIDEELARK